MPTTITPVIPEDLVLRYGGHSAPEQGMCFMEAWAYIRGLPFSDSPECASRVVAAFLRRYNDGLRSDEERTRVLGPLLTLEFPAGSEAVELRRAYLALDWLIRVYTPAFLDLVPALQPHAAQLRALPEITDADTGAASRDAAGDAYRAAAASLEPVAQQLQASVQDLVRRMATVRE